MTFMELAKARYSLRKFDGRPVDPEALKTILEAGRIAPTATNAQPVKVYVIQSEEALAKMNALTRCVYGASTVLLVCEKTDVMWKNPLEEGVDAGELDASIVTTHMMLQAKELGVDSLWVGFFPPTKTKEAFGLPDNENPVIVMPLGYPAEGAEPAARHFERIPMDAFEEEL